jgi:hypothetical protein
MTKDGLLLADPSDRAAEGSMMLPVNGEQTWDACLTKVSIAASGSSPTKPAFQY